ncbi:MAG: zf-HC2 domain-containing protein, partial [bacterium]
MPEKSYNEKGASGKCLSDDQLYRYLEKLLPKAENRAVQEHLDSCSACFDDMVAFARNAHTPASEAEKLEITSLRKRTPQEQVAKILDYVEAECPPEGSTLNESARKALDDSSMLHIKKSFWQDLWQRVFSPRLLPRYAFALATLLILVAGSFVGIRYYQNTYPLVQVERNLRAHYQTYINVQNYVESMPRLSGGYAHQPFMLMGEDSASYLEQSR